VFNKSPSAPHGPWWDYQRWTLRVSVICRIYILRSLVKILFYSVLPIVFLFRAKPFLYLGTIRRMLIWKYRMFTAICIPSFGMDQNNYYTVYWYKYWLAINPGLGGVGSYMNFHYCPWTGSIKPSLQYFHICCFRWLSMFPFLLFHLPELHW
jgi:hypothetical protein